MRELKKTEEPVRTVQLMELQQDGVRKEVMFYLLDEQWFTEDSGPFAFFLKQTQTLPHVFLQ